MCFSQYAQYVPRPVVETNYQYEAPVRPEGAPPTKADMDENLFGPKPLPPEWQQKKVAEAGYVDHNNGHHHHHNDTAAPAAVAGLNASVAAIVVELTNGTKLRISISQE